MTPVKGEYFHDPANGTWGDCHRAAMASLLDLPLSAVPHFNDGGAHPDEFYRRMKDFLALRGLRAVEVPVFADAGSLPILMKNMKNLNPGMHYLLGGTSALGVGHSVICYEDQIVHDPSPVDSGIVGPFEDGYFLFVFVGKMVE